MEITKTIANCPMDEFLPQAYKLVSEFKKVFGDKKIQEQGGENLKEILCELMTKEPKKTAKLIALMCFIDEKDIKEYNGIDFMLPVFDILANPQIINFLVRLMDLTR